MADQLPAAQNKDVTTFEIPPAGRIDVVISAAVGLGKVTRAALHRAGKDATDGKALPAVC
jgi:hypothetical protein